MTEETRDDRASKSIIGMPVYSIQEGMALGFIKQILIEGKVGSVIGFILEKRRFSREERILPFSAVSGFGEDTITVERQNLLERKGANPQFMRAIRSPLPIIGSRVFTAGGKTLGRVEEYRFSPENGAISGLEIAGDGLFRVRSLVDGQHIIAIAPRTIMLKDAAIDSAISLENSFMTGMENAAATVRERAADLRNNASQAGRKLSASFNETMSRLRQQSAEGDRELDDDLTKKEAAQKSTQDFSQESSQEFPIESAMESSRGLSREEKAEKSKPAPKSAPENMDSTAAPKQKEATADIEQQAAGEQQKATKDNPGNREYTEQADESSQEQSNKQIQA